MEGAPCPNQEHTRGGARREGNGNEFSSDGVEHLQTEMHSDELVQAWSVGERSGYRRHIDSLGKFLSSDEELHRLTTREVRTCGHRRDGVSLGHSGLSTDFSGMFDLQYLTQKGRWR